MPSPEPIFSWYVSMPLYKSTTTEIRGREQTEGGLTWHLNRSTQLAKELAEKKLEHIALFCCVY
jgi:hypothetical protein